MRSDKEIASIEDADKISRYVSVWVNTFPEKPVPIIKFEQMELEFFCEPGTDMEWFQYWRAFCRDWLLSLGT